MKHNKIIVILMAIVLLAVTFVSAANLRTQTSAQEAEGGQQPPTRIPDIPHVMVAGYEQDEYFELSLKVSAKRFQTAGVVLSYDAAALTPVGWTSGGLDENGNPREVSLEGHADWSNPAVLPTKGTDELAGKPALCYVQRNEDETPKRGYFYLGADTLKYTDLLDERVVTVRFRKTAETKVTMPTEPGSDITDEANFTVCLAATEVAKDAIPGGQLLLTVQGSTDPLKRCSKFRHTTGPILPDETTPTTTTTPEPTAQETEPETGGGTEPGTEDGGETTPTPADYDCTLSFGFWDGPSADSSGGGSGDYAITFFDWDGRVIDAIAAPENAVEAVQKWQSQTWVTERLGNKKGYAFDQWLIVSQEGESLETKNGTFTSNDTPLDLSDNAVKADVATPEFLKKLEPTTIKTGDTEEKSYSVLLQAAYRAKTDPEEYPAAHELINNGITGDSSYAYYTLSDPVYTRYGTADAVAGSYSLTMTVTREQTRDGKTWGVTRLREPAIIVTMVPTTSGSANILNLIRLENTDETTFEIVTTKQIKEVKYKVVDVYNMSSNWIGCADKSMEPKKQKNACISNGTRAFLAQQAFNVCYGGGSWDSTVNDWAFGDACLYAKYTDQANGNSVADTSSGDTTRAANTWWTLARQNTAKTNLTKKTEDVNKKNNVPVPADQRRALTSDEVLAVLKGVS